MQKELVLNQLMINIHRIQIDPENEQAKTDIQHNIWQLDKTIETIEQHPSVNASIKASLSLWPVINRYADNLSKLPTLPSDKTPQQLVNALREMEKALLLLRQSLPPANPQKVLFLTQATLMQKLSIEYMKQLRPEYRDQAIVSGRQQLQRLADNIENSLITLGKNYQRHPHASQPIRQATIFWRFMQGNIKNFPKKPAPEMIAYYGEKIVDKLTSASFMF